jgi:multidrug transporter EmrE-like cation transporter
MGISVVGTLVVDVTWYQQPWNALRAACVALIALGTCGLTLIRTP